MKLTYVIIYVEDVVKATQFYNLAFGLEVKFIHESNMYAEMKSGETTLSFAANSMLEANTGIEPLKGVKNCFEIALTTDDVKGALDKAVSNGARIIKEPQTKPWGQVVAYVQDPFGTIVEICTPMQ
ncbi:VOC family protein [Chitinispirillales bacterium ANBcel5]|uniref:VOC family protein n=1 Tax=Cellulosispirillum alkaliphilum TaxID=3039283 RepID=UPI002A4E5681|nr:VOC family protein [Chitinispirillales bacterium ANBcel5]